MHGTHSRSLELETHLRPKPKPTESTGQRVVNLALQGGGSHGAFTWGVLDRLLEEKQTRHRGHYRDERRRRQCRGSRAWLGSGGT